MRSLQPFHLRTSIIVWDQTFPIIQFTFCDVSTVVGVQFAKFSSNFSLIKVLCFVRELWLCETAARVSQVIICLCYPDKVSAAYLVLSVERLPQLSELPEVDALVAVLVGCLDQRLGLGVRHLAAHLPPIRDEYLLWPAVHQSQPTLEMSVFSSSAEIMPSPSASNSLKASLSSVSLAPAIVLCVLSRN